MTSAANPGRQSIDYELHGHEYARRPDPRIAARMNAALGDAPMVVNVGAAGAFMSRGSPCPRIRAHGRQRIRDD